jgi:low temperature requirement protein LtrA
MRFTFHPDSGHTMNHDLRPYLRFMLGLQVLILVSMWLMYFAGA